uniref:Uncharacterized protein n=1 Tax=Oryza nivara TaxID=4536 RepID=A0A0E0IRK3_ORYNI
MPLLLAAGISAVVPSHRPPSRPVVSFPLRTASSPRPVIAPSSRCTVARPPSYHGLKAAASLAPMSSGVDDLVSFI